VRAILITGKPEIFTAGNDLDDFLNNVGEGAMTEDRPVFQFMQALEGCTKPVSRQSPAPPSASAPRC
jgi:enoyl-CoA hydratase/carnithine racemase